MKIKSFVSAALLLVTAVATVSFAAEKEKSDYLLASGHPEYPPFVWQEDGKMVGLGPEILTDACKKLGIPLKIEPQGTWENVTAITQEGKIDAIAALLMNEQRKEYLDYSIAYAEAPVVIFVRKDKSFVYNNWSDLLGKKGTSIIGESHGQDLDQFIAQKLNVSRLKSAKDCFDALLGGKADYFMYGMYPGLLEVRKEELDNRITFLKPYLTTEKWYLAFSKKSNYTKYLPKINAIISDMATNGQIKKWTTKYFAYFEEHDIDRVKQLVDAGIEYYMKNGPDKAFAEFNNPKGKFSKAGLYLFAIDFNGKCLAHGQDPSLVGKTMLNRQDPDGKFHVREMIETAKNPGEGWISYKRKLKDTGELASKVSYLKRVKGKDLLIGSGFYTEK